VVGCEAKTSILCSAMRCVSHGLCMSNRWSLSHPCDEVLEVRVSGHGQGHVGREVDEPPQQEVGLATHAEHGDTVRQQAREDLEGPRQHLQKLGGKFIDECLTWLSFGGGSCSAEVNILGWLQQDLWDVMEAAP
jgi:hypothetical protein